MTLVFLGQFREISGVKLSELTLPQGVQNLAQFQAWLAHAEPALAQELKRTRTQFAVNQTIVRDPGHPIHDEDEIAFLPPMSGG